MRNLVDHGCVTTQIVRSWREGQPVTKLRFTTYLLHNVLSAVVWRVTAELEGTRSRCRVEGLIAKKLLFERHDERYASDMATIVEIEKLALNLPEKERATLAANLLEKFAPSPPRKIPRSPDRSPRTGHEPKICLQVPLASRPV